jgi:hypothetical protein
MTNQEEMTVEAARGILRKEYWDDVRDTAKAIKDAWDSKEIDDREGLIEYIDETVDGAGRVIYTGQAMDCLRYSDNDEAGIDELGASGFDWSNGVPWSQLAYFAFRADIMNQLDAEGLDVNDPQRDEDDEEETEEEES